MNILSDYRLIPLDRLTHSPFNPRRNFAGAEFEGLVESVRQVGIIEPILVRPKGEGFEIVAGHRRFEALKKAANGTAATATIPAMVSEMDDDTAFDLQTIENLHREDLSEREEAESFKSFIEKHAQLPEDRARVILELSDRTGIPQGYIRRRESVMRLPARALDMWQAGDLKYGHLEQLLRLKSEEKVLEYIERIETVHYRDWTVRELKREIDRESVDLTEAVFDKAGCQACPSNSEVQRSLFGFEDAEKVHCLDPECYRAKLVSWMTENWESTAVRKKHKTNGFLFYSYVSYNDYHLFHDKTPKDCKACPNFVSLLNLDGTAYQGKVCSGSAACHKEKVYGAGSGKGTAESGAGKSKDWHGTYFRQRFFQKELPLRFGTAGPACRETWALEFAAMVIGNRELHPWFAVKYLGADPEEQDLRWMSVSHDQVIESIDAMDANAVLQGLSEAAVQLAISVFSNGARRAVAERWAGIDLTREFVIDLEYLKKKTKDEILALGRDLGVFDEAPAVEHLQRIRRKSFEACKKTELIAVFLDSGVDLSGRVPAEILEARDKEGIDLR